MTDTELHVGGGATTVGSEPMLLMEEGLRRQAVRCRSAVAALRTLDDGRGVNHLATDLRDVSVEAGVIADRLALLAVSLRGALDLYAGAERFARSAVERAASELASFLGTVASRLGILLAPSLITAASVGSAWLRLLPPSAGEVVRRAGESALQDAAQLLADPDAIEVVRWLVTLSDDAALGVLGAPPAVAPLIGESGAGLTGVPTSATTVLGLAVLARIHGTAPTTVRPVDPAVGTPLPRTPAVVVAPSSVAERVARIPHSAGPQVRVERYATAEGERFEVYIGGTDPAAPPGGDNPWDMASNIALVAEQEASSQQAVAQALADAGATRESPVVFTGYSQGAAIAVRMAESGLVDTTGLITIGGPTGGIPVTGEYPALVIEHRDDIVTALGGVRRDTAATVITTTAIPESADSPLDAHDRGLYAQTAERVDASELEAISGLRNRFPHGGEPGTATLYRATRQSPP